MSDIGDVMDAVLTHVGVAIPAATTLRGFIPIRDIPTADLPHVQAFAPATEIAEVLVWRQEVQNIGFTVLMTTRGETQEAIITKFESIQTRLDTDRLLSNTVRWVSIPSMEVNEAADSKTGYQTLAFEVVAEVLD